jgi:hypothetical protein
MKKMHPKDNDIQNENLACMESETKVETGDDST